MKVIYLNTHIEHLLNKIRLSQTLILIINKKKQYIFLRVTNLKLFRIQYETGESSLPKFPDVNNVHSVTGRENTDPLSFRILTRPNKLNLVRYYAY